VTKSAAGTSEIHKHTFTSKIHSCAAKQTRLRLPLSRGKARLLSAPTPLRQRWNIKGRFVPAGFIFNRKYGPRTYNLKVWAHVGIKRCGERCLRLYVVRRKLTLDRKRVSHQKFCKSLEIHAPKSLLIFFKLIKICLKNEKTKIELNE
jgi:hypothetical protein